jgi:hypothetical protein
MAEHAGPVVHGTRRGGGYYSAVTLGAKDAIVGAIPLVRAAIRRLPDADTSRLIYGEAQGTQGLLQYLGGVLRLAVITCKALLRFEATPLSGFRAFFDVWCRGGHGALLDSVWVFGHCSLPKGT